MAEDAYAGALEARQRAFCAHLRDPDRRAPPPDVAPRRMAVYRELVFNTVEGLLAANFPVIRALHDAPAWQARVRAFLRDHVSHTPLFTEVGREFVRFLDARAEAGADDPPYLAELAHYEWSELALMLDEASLADAPAHDAGGDLAEGVPVLSPLLRVLAYRHPVHRIGPAAIADATPQQPTLIALTRDADGDVHFLEIDALTALLIEALRHDPDCSGGEAVARVLAQLGRDEPALRAAGLAMLAELRRHGALLGTRRG
ncbi:MAG TPA: putative DNA-binding domain-containing protein [Dokdonella sp.]|uniref:HvfC family RiPP maturation protein n=1 Tax=Dokdonella sp. TaxID=2291710 RepID=UPI002BF2B74E|nr:putative DNA-binding domain-containing protein [Dokdonella sp.]HUD42777.1 putative DNA-binding domain-containing protein [Dokdonella sp.]